VTTPNDQQPIADWIARTPRQFVSNLDRAVRLLFSDGHRSAIRSVFPARLSAPPKDGVAPAKGVRQQVRMSGRCTIPVEGTSLLDLQHKVSAMVDAASSGLDCAAGQLPVRSIECLTWAEGVEAARSRLRPPYIWVISTDLEEALRPLRRRNVVALPGRGLQPDGKLLGSDVYFRPRMEPADKLFAFRQDGGCIWLPGPLDVTIQLLKESVVIEVQREAVVELLGPRFGVEVRLVTSS